MATFSYIAVNSRGQQVRGSMEATDAASVKERIKIELGMFPIKIVKGELPIQKPFFQRLKSWFFGVEDVSVGVTSPGPSVTVPTQPGVVKGRFSYTAVDAKGRQIKGTMEAFSAAEVTERVKGMGYFPTRIGLG